MPRMRAIDAAVHDVQLTMLITIALVVLVIFFFVWAVLQYRRTGPKRPHHPRDHLVNCQRRPR